VAGYSSYTREWLMRGVVDLACLHDPQPQRGFDIVPLVREEVFLVGRPGVLPNSIKSIRPEDLAGLPLILTSRPNASRRLLDGWAAGRGLSLDVRMEVDDTTLIRALLARGAGFSLLTRGSFLSELQHREFVALPLRPRAYWPLALVRSTAEPISELTDKAVEQIRAIVDELTRSGGWPGGSAVRPG
jgi:LysR family nitrogen assimilation transcriptional regulator